MTPRIINREIGAGVVCATCRTHQGTLSSCCVLRKNKSGPRNDVREVRGPQSGLRGSVGNEGRGGVPRKLETKRSRRSSAALQERTASNAMGSSAGGDQLQVGTEKTKADGVAKGAERGLAAPSLADLQETPKGVPVEERSVSRGLRAFPNFCDASKVESVSTRPHQYSCALEKSDCVVRCSATQTNCSASRYLI